LTYLWTESGKEEEEDYVSPEKAYHLVALPEEAMHHVDGRAFF
jgi:hypothetical protein